MDPGEHARLAEHEEWYWWHQARERIVHRVLRRQLSPPVRLLDVGCGTGATTASLRAFGSVVGLDIGASALDRARQRGVVGARASAARLPVRPGSFDAVVGLDVLEHLEDDGAAASEMLAALAPGGLLLVTVPAYAFLWSSHDDALGHRRRYVMAAILPAALVVRLSERLRPHRRRVERSGYVPVPGFVNALLAWLVGLDGALLRWLRLPFGLSILAVARRPRRPA
jgi:SAM-dependent methyltransferase